MLKEYDIIVAGAGPAGSTAARYAAQRGVSVLLLEKENKPGACIRCGEAVNKNKLKEFIDPDPEWICSTINSFSLFAPDGSEISLNFDEEGYILDRSIFDYRLALSAVHEGAELVSDAYVYDLITDNGTVKGVRVETGSSKSEIKSKVVIAADGVGSRIGRFAGIRTFIDFRDMECCVQVTASGINYIQENRCYFYFGKDYAPEGYVWVFPKGNNTANIGVGISGYAGKSRSASAYLQNFIDKYYPGIRIVKKVAGGVPSTTTLKQLTSPGIMLVGDSARQVNPLSGGGIVSGITAGSIAGRVAAESVLLNRPDHISSYESDWYHRLGKKHEIYNLIKKGVFNFDDARLNSLAKTFQEVPPGKRSLGRLFYTALINNPSLLPEVAKVFVV